MVTDEIKCAENSHFSSQVSRKLLLNIIALKFRRL